MDLRYKHVEAALVDVAGVKPKAIGAFRGKLRHLRNLGLPALPTSGSGKHIAYSRRQALEMLVAVKLQQLGHKADSAARLSPSIVRQVPYGKHQGDECYVALRPPGDDPKGYHLMYGDAQVCEFLKSSPDVFTVVIVSALVRQLDLALDRSLKSA